MGDSAGLPVRTPAKTPASSKRPGLASTGKQQSILGFFSKSASAGSAGGGKENQSSSPAVKETPKAKAPPKAAKRSSSSITPAASSDPAEPHSSQENRSSAPARAVRLNLPSPLTPADVNVKQAAAAPVAASSSPSRKVQYPVRAWES